MSPVAELALVFVAACGLGLGLAFGRFYWSRDEVIARRRRRALRRVEHAGARAEARRRLDRERVARMVARGEWRGQVRVEGAPPIPIRPTPPGPPPR